MMNQRGTITIEKQNANGDRLGAGYVFRIIADEDIYNAARTVKYYSKGELVARITTESTGLATKTSLPLGNYIASEESVIAPYLLNTEPQKVSLQYKDQVTPVIYESLTFKNDEPTRKSRDYKR